MTSNGALRAFHNSKKVKNLYVARLKTHMDADELIRGTGYEYENGRGCGVGCILNAYDHERFESELGMPTELAYLLDTLHERCSGKVWPTFAHKFLVAIRPGADLTRIACRMKLFILERNRQRVLTLDIAGELKAQCSDAIAQCEDVLKNELTGLSDHAALEPARSAARSAADSASRSARSARSAADSAAYSAADLADLAARSAAYSAADLADLAARSAARSAAYSAAYSAAPSAACTAADSAAYLAAYAAEFDAIANTLIELVKAA